MKPVLPIKLNFHFSPTRKIQYVKICKCQQRGIFFRSCAEQPFSITAWTVNEPTFTPKLKSTIKLLNALKQCGLVRSWAGLRVCSSQKAVPSPRCPSSSSSHLSPAGSPPLQSCSPPVKQPQPEQEGKAEKSNCINITQLASGKEQAKILIPQMPAPLTSLLCALAKQPQIGQQGKTGRCKISRGLLSPSFRKTKCSNQRNWFSAYI